MTLRQLPEIKAPQRPQNFQWDAPADVLARWADMPLAADSESDNTIAIFDVIGEDWWSGGGFTAKRMRAALRSIGNKPVTVQINSPGGDMFEGIAIFNQLREHPAKVTVEVMGYAASAASIIAMAGDDIRMGLGTFMMVHNAWGIVIGNRHDMREASDLFEGFDSALVDIYEARTGQERADIEKLMDAETFLGPSDAVDKGFADVVDNSLKSEQKAHNQANRSILVRRQMEAGLAKAGFTRNDRSEMFTELFAGAAPRDAGRTKNAARDAGLGAAALAALATLRS